MIKEPALPRPTDAEIQILRVIWQRGPSTVREIHEQLSQDHHILYTTALKLLQIMTEKGLVERDESQRAHIYSARLTQQRAQRMLLGDLLERAFDGSAAALVMQALSSRKTSAAELAEIRQLLASIEGDER